MSRLDDIKAHAEAASEYDESPIAWDYRVTENDVRLLGNARQDIPDLLRVAEAAVRSMSGCTQCKAWMALAPSSDGCSRHGFVRAALRSLLEDKP